MSSKARGRSAIIYDTTPNGPLISTIANPTLTTLQQQYVPSLLKIESVVPTRITQHSNHRNIHHNRANRLIHRSYSTLCNSSPVSYKNVSKKINTNLQRQKNHHQQQERNGYTESAGRSAGTKNSQTDSSVVFENGVCKVRRENKDREKQSDRINLDRRGLSTVPIIENEPNLRLLSLQHNLINKIFIPDHEIVNVAPSENINDVVNGNIGHVTTNSANLVDGVKDNNNNVQKPDELAEKNSMTTSSTVTAPSQIAYKSLAPKPFLKQKSISRNQLNLNFNNINSNNGTTSFLQKSFMQTKSNLLKKSNSLMINNYSPITPPLTPTTGTSFLASFTMRNKLIATPSFSIVEENHREITSPPTTTSSTTITTTATTAVNLENSSISVKYSLANLVFLDLYNNQIEKIENLDGLKSLTVLLLGKNRISDISGIVSLKATLRVLDLHGNKINNITQKISQLQELKSLNLAGNLLRQIHPSDFSGLFCLKELNLKRNRIKKINGFDDLHNLERLWLCHNDLQSIEDMQAIAKSINLKEITIENNPISLGGDSISFLVSYLPLLMSLNQLQITEQVRRAANAWRKSKENTDQNYQHLSTDVCNSIRREEIISNARTNWELIRSQQSTIISASHRNGFNKKHTEQHASTATSKSSNHTKHSSSSTSSTASSNNQQDIETVKKPINKKSSAVKKTKGKLKRSSSQENTSSILSEQDDDADEYFHLPPILTPYLEPEKNPSTSSMKPNIDSGSSNYSSDNENDEKSGRRSKSKVPTTPPINVAISQPPSPFELKNCDERSETSYTPPLPYVSVEKSLNGKEFIPINESSPEENRKTPSPFSNYVGKEKAILTIVDNCNGISLQPTNTTENNIDINSKPLKTSTPPTTDNTLKSDQETDKLSIISKNSAKTSSESINTISSSVNDEKDRINHVTTSHRNIHHHTATTKNRSANQNKKYTPTLTRAQTARNFGNNQQQTTNNNPTKPKEPKRDVEKDQGADYLVEICGRYLNIYGVGALKFVDKQWNVQKANDVHTVKFSYINFNSICPILSKVKVRFPNVENYLFRETNILCYGQLNALADTQGIKSLTIEPDGNPIAVKNWRPYAIYRLSHWGLKQINGVEVTEEEIQEAEVTYNGLSELVLWSLPDSLLQPLFARLHVDEVLQNNKVTAKEWLMQYADESIRHVVGKEALQWKKLPNSQDESTVRRKGKAHFGTMMENTCNAVEKLHKLDFLWPTILVEMIRNTLIDYSQIDVYVRNLMSEVLKEKQ